MLKVESINVYYGNIHAIKDVSFEVLDGEIVTLIGANGAGKSTILKTISGLLHTRTGDVLFGDHSIKSVAPHKIVAQGRGAGAGGKARVCAHERGGEFGDGRVHATKLRHR